MINTPTRIYSLSFPLWEYLFFDFLYMTLRSRLMIGLIAIASFPLISSGTEGTVGAPPPPPTPHVYTETEIAYIRGLNCDTFTEAAAKTRCLDIKKMALSQ